MVHRFIDYIVLTIGSVIVAAGLELILAPNGLVDGGVTAISIMSNAVYGVPIWAVFIGMNLPTLLFAYKSMGKRFVIRTFYANVVTSFSLWWFHPWNPITTSELLIVLYGGFLLGVGVGLVVKVGGAIDGSEVIAIWVNKKFHIPISKFLLAINAVILTFAAFVYTLENAMFSIAVFFIVTKMIDFILDGINQGKSVVIISNHPEEIGQRLMHDLQISITYLHGSGGFTGEERKLIYCITDRFVYPKLKEVVGEVDPEAILEASFVTETAGVKKSKFTLLS